MKKILLMGLNPTTTEAAVRSWLSSYGKVEHVDLVREGDSRAPVAVVDMEISDGQAFFVVSRISSYWHDGALVSARLLPH